MREPVALPATLGPAGLFGVSWRCGGADRLDRIGGRSQLVCRDVRDERGLSRRERRVPRGPAVLSRRRIGMPARRSRVGHANFPARPGSGELDRTARAIVARADTIEVVQHVLGAVGGPHGERVMVRVLERAATPNGDEPRVAILAEDHLGLQASAMRQARSGQTTVDRLLNDLAGDTDDGLLTDELRAWLTASPRLRAFAHEYRDKIRKKLRSAADADAARDVRTELRFAQALLADRRIELAFESYGARRVGPDFTVRFRGEQPFNCEVSRVRRIPSEILDGGPLLAKLRQLPPSVPNLLVIAISGRSAAELDMERAMRGLRRRADDKEDAFFARRGFEGARAFYARFLRLGGVIVWCETAHGKARAALWRNRSARIAVSERAARACLACLRDDAPRQ